MTQQSRTTDETEPVENLERPPEGDHRGILHDLWREFRIPLACFAAALAAGATTETFRHIQQFFLGFFALSWFSGQWNRVKRDRERKKDAREAEQHLISLSKKLDSQLTALAGFTTGGNAKLAISIELLTFVKTVQIDLTNTGEYPIYEPTAEFYLMEGKEDPSEVVTEWKGQTLRPGDSAIAFSKEFNDKDKTSYIGNIKTRNYSYTIELIILSTDGEPQIAYQVRCEKEPWSKSIPEGFPHLYAGLPRVFLMA